MSGFTRLHSRPARSGRGLALPDLAVRAAQARPARRSRPAVVAMVLGVALSPLAACEPSPGTRTLYVDCGAGRDGADGRSPATAWRTLARANAADLGPGESLRLRRGCTWTETLHAHWHGTAPRPVVIGPYGSGALPRIRNVSGSNVRITGSHQVIGSLHASHDALPVDPGCADQPVGYVVGFNFASGAHHNTLQDSEADGHTAGVKLSWGASHNKVLRNHLHHNRAMQTLDPERGPGHDDLGAWGVIVNGDDNEIAFNRLHDNNARCTYDHVSAGNSVELFAARRNTIHHNLAVGDKVFSELGSSTTRRAVDNRFLYNVVRSSFPSAKFVVTRGARSEWGPVERTTVVNNTIHLTASDSEGVVCGGGCGPDVLRLHGNVVVAERKALYADEPFAESANVYWGRGGAPVIQTVGFTISQTSAVADPAFVDATGGDLQLTAGSPALDRAGTVAVALGQQIDARGTTLPQGPAVDAGAYERPVP